MLETESFAERYLTFQYQNLLRSSFFSWGAGFAHLLEQSLSETLSEQQRNWQPATTHKRRRPRCRYCKRQDKKAVLSGPFQPQLQLVNKKIVSKRRACSFICILELTSTCNCPEPLASSKSRFSSRELPRIRPASLSDCY